MRFKLVYEFNKEFDVDEVDKLKIWQIAELEKELLMLMEKGLTPTMIDKNG